MKPTNIWQNLQHKDGKYYLQDDLKYIDVYNKIYIQKNSKVNSALIDLRCVPEPRLGSIDAPIYLLQLNPSKVFHTENNNVQLEILSLKNDIMPHIYLENENTWWDKYLLNVKNGFRKVLKDNGISDINVIRRILSNNICSLEYFPYNSIKFEAEYLHLPSQQYTRELVLYAIKNNKCIIISRSKKLWYGLVPELFGYKNVYFGSSNQSVYVSQNNIINKTGNRNQLKEIFNKYINI